MGAGQACAPANGDRAADCILISFLCLNDVEAKMPGRVEQLGVARDERAAAGVPLAPCPCGGELQGIGATQWKAFNEILSLLSHRRTR